MRFRPCSQPHPSETSITAGPRLTFLLPTFSVNSWCWLSSLTQPSSSWYLKCCFFCIKGLVWMFDIHIPLLCFYKRHWGWVMERIQRRGREHRQRAECFPGSVQSLSQAQCTPKTWLLGRSVYYRQQQKWWKSKLACFSYISHAPYSWWSPSEAFLLCLILDNSLN